jgi:HSP20 family protein
MTLATLQPRFSSRMLSPFDDLLRTNFLDRWNQDLLTTPSVNIRETKKEYLVELAVPGMRKEDFNINVENNVMTVSCEKEEEKTDNDEDNWARREYNYSRFSRTFTIPDNANGEKVSAKYVDGVLHLSLPKTGDTAKPSGRRIKVD